ncbi:MAG: glycosyltransferase family 2 protein [Candidatus Omnitrophota bacterium]|nr:glycosyltransferase family 2 protein [Candidatus Omnitrophota bacterium]
MTYQSSPEISFIVPCYNEAGNIASTLETIMTFMKDHDCLYEILVVDDGSIDSTSDAVRIYCEAHPQVPVSVQINRKNLGLGRNYLDGAQRARGRYYMLVNGDNDIRAADLSAIVARRGTADMIIPFVANQYDRPIVRNLVSRLFTVIVNATGGHLLKYYNGPVLHLRENVLRFEPPASGHGYQAELLCRTLSAGCTYEEVPFYSVRSIHNRSSAFRFANMVSVVKSLVRIYIHRFRRATAKAQKL